MIQLFITKYNMITKLIILIILIYIVFYRFMFNNKKSYKKFSYNIKDIKNLPKGYKQLPYFKSELSDINNMDNKKCIKKCNEKDNCAGVFIWEYGNDLSSCNIIYKDKNVKGGNLVEFYEKNGKTDIMDTWEDGNTYIKKMNST